MTKKQGVRSHLNPGYLASVNCQDGAPLRIWIVPGDKDRNIQRHFVFEMVGGPKAYMNLWLPGIDSMGGETVEWSWVVHPSAVMIWEHVDAD